MEPTWTSDCGTVRLWCADCRDVLPTLPSGSVDAVVTDPPWGIDADTDYTRFVGGLSDSRNFGSGIQQDDEPFDPRPFLNFPHVALWGANCFANHLPIGRWLCWLKKRESQIGTFMSDCELAWVKKAKTPRRAPGVYAFTHVWHGFDRQSENGSTLHPTQKPIELMRWTIELAAVPIDGRVLDPFMGSGTTGVAAVKFGRKFLGIEIDAGHFATAKRRIQDALNSQPLFKEQGTETQVEMFE
jgi:site-specific DNA-methyltransferase (adenine-specific)